MHKIKMRHHEKEIQDRQTIAGILNTCHTGHLGTVGADGYPMVKPLNFVCCGEKIFFHSSLEGEKIRDIGRDSRVCFEVDMPIRYRRACTEPCEADYDFRSVIIRGRAHLVRDRDEKIKALKWLMEKYQPSGGYGDFSPRKLSITAVVRIDIEAMSAKESMKREKSDAR